MISLELLKFSLCNKCSKLNNKKSRKNTVVLDDPKVFSFKKLYNCYSGYWFCNNLDSLNSSKLTELNEVAKMERFALSRKPKLSQTRATRDN